MLILDCDGTPLWPEWAERTDAHTKTTIDLPAALAFHDSSVIERLIGAVFDQLHRSVVELRLRPVFLITVAFEPSDGGVSRELAQVTPRTVVTRKVDI
jgi:hypothetical protein